MNIIIKALSWKVVLTACIIVVAGMEENEEGGEGGEMANNNNNFNFQRKTNFPTQIHLAYTGEPSEMMISYSTNYSTRQTIAKIKLHKTTEWTHTFIGHSTKFTDYFRKYYHQYSHLFLRRFQIDVKPNFN